MRKIALALVLSLALVSCSEPAEPTAPTDEAAAPTEKPSAKAGGGDKKKGDADEKKGTASGDDSKKKKGGGAGGGSSKGGGGADGAGGSDNPYTEGPGEDDGSSALFTAAGEYVYEQSGYERFCSTTSCERQDLPSRQSLKVTVKARSADSATVVTEAEASDNRLMRTTTRFTRAVAAVTDVYVRFTYEGFTFENSYQPQPPVESLRFPLSEGQKWAGRWRDSTSGTYRFGVAAREEIEVGGAAVQAFKIVYEMTFKGEFDGTSSGTVWVDPATKAVVNASGILDLRSAFGRYTTEGTTRLVSGPRYR